VEPGVVVGQLSDGLDWIETPGIDLAGGGDQDRRGAL